MAPNLLLRSVFDHNYIEMSICQYLFRRSCPGENTETKINEAEQVATKSKIKIAYIKHGANLGEILSSVEGKLNSENSNPIWKQLSVTGTLKEERQEDEIADKYKSASPKI